MAAKTVVIGAGLAGLSAALRIARDGGDVVVVERTSEVGGRAVSKRDGGFTMNLGAHAMYPRASALLAELGIDHPGETPAARGQAAFGDVLHTLPVGFVSMLTTGLLGLGDKLEVAKLLAGLPRVDATALASTPVRSWIDASVAGARARSLLEALVRVTTYADAPALQSAGHAMDLMQLVLRTNVRYVHGGWQVIVDALRAAAVAAGARIITGARAVGIDRQGATVRAVKLEDGASLPAETVVVATAPASAARLSGSASLAAWAARARPAKAACLDLALSSLPVARATFALGIDRPLYLSVHSTAARGLAPDGAALVHLAKYLDPDVQHDSNADRAELESLMDRVQPGWRELVVSARFLPALTVTHAIPLAAEHGTRDRPRPDLADAPGVLVAGDWVGDGHLAEAALLSAKIAAEAIRASARPTSEGAAAA